jgi:voltage-gated potassium channel
MSKAPHESNPAAYNWRDHWHEIIFEAETKAGKRFDVALLWLIVLSVAVVMLESVGYIHDEHGDLLFTLEIVFTVIFTIEYVMRLLVVQKPWKYAFSFFGLVDLLSIIPTYLAIFSIGSSSLLVIRILRLMRIFRVLKLIGFVKEGQMLRKALNASRHKISVFLLAVSSAVVVLGTVMYLVEGPENGFTSIPRSIYWAVITLTTVGYGDIYPHTPVGQALASIVMILGYAIIAVPTGIVSSEMVKADAQNNMNTRSCTSCGEEGHFPKANFCRQCGANL